jgi:hypothetical protein
MPYPAASRIAICCEANVPLVHVSLFPFGPCSDAYMIFNEEFLRNEINLGFTTDCNTRGFKLLIEETKKILILNQMEFDENLYQYRNHSMIEQNLSDIAELDVIT